MSCIYALMKHPNIPSTVYIEIPYRFSRAKLTTLLYPNVRRRLHCVIGGETTKFDNIRHGKPTGAVRNVVGKGTIIKFPPQLTVHTHNHTSNTGLTLSFLTASA